MESFGFSSKSTGGHLARSMMLTEITQLCESLPVHTTPEQYEHAIVEQNVLSKPTQSSRTKSLWHLEQLYGLDPTLTLFRALRELAGRDPSALPLIALVCTFCRDVQLRASFDLLGELRPGDDLPRARMERYLEESFPGRFSAAMKKSLAQNVNTTWTASGHLSGKAKKIRSRPAPKPLASVYAALAAYLLGLRGEFLLNSVFARLVAADGGAMATHLGSSSARDYLRFRHAGGVTEIDFTPFLTPEELIRLHGTD